MKSFTYVFIFFPNRIKSMFYTINLQIYYSDNNLFNSNISEHFVHNKLCINSNFDVLKLGEPVN